MAALSVHTSTSALLALRHYTAAERGLDGVSRRVETGLRVVGPRDDASSFAVAQGVRGDIKAWQAVEQGLDSARGTVNMALAGATAISERLGDLRKKVIEYFAADPARQAIIAADINALLDTIDAAANGATYNGTNLLTTTQASAEAPQPADEGTTFSFAGAGSQTINLGSYTGFLRIDYTRTGGSGGGSIRLIYDGNVVDSHAVSPGQPSGTLTFDYPAAPSTQFTLQLQGSPGPNVDFQFYLDTDPITDPGSAQGDFRVARDMTGSVIDIQYRSMRAEDLGLRDLNLGSVQGALAQITSASRAVNRDLGYYAARLRDIEHSRAGARRFQDALVEGLGSLVDADLMRDSALLQAAQVRRSLAVQSLALANQRPQAILGLLQG